MSKRRLITLALAIVFVLSIAVFAVAPQTQTSSAPTGGHSLASLKAFEPAGRTFRPPTCPDPGATGCGG